MAGRRKTGLVNDPGHKQVSGRITAEAAERLTAMRAATGWRVQDIMSAALISLHESQAMDSVLTALRNLRKEVRIADNGRD